MIKTKKTAIVRALTFCAATVVFFLFLEFKKNTHPCSLNNVNYIVPSSARKSKLGDGCHHIYLDVGANIGVHTRFLYEPQHYPKAKMAHNIFNREYGSNRSNFDFCAFGFEPNPAHAARHQRLESAYQALGWRYHFIPAAASDEVGNMTFYHNNDENMMEWGFGDHNLNAGTPVTVPLMRLSTWLRDEILDRNLPETVHGNYVSGPKVVMKMDIESSEFKVLPDLWFSGVLCKTVDFFFGEIHDWRIDYESDEKTSRGDLHLHRGDSGPVLRDGMKLFQSLKDCKTRMIEADDEVYLHDGIPLPTL